LQPDREPESLTLPIGLPLGVGIEDRVGVTMPLPPASSLVVYTDGLVERRDRDLDIHELLSTAGASAEQSAQELLTALTEAAGVSVSHDDDVTALVVRRT
jgi:serine phosphatase RsbU (regulator of sigma subunit)